MATSVSNAVIARPMRPSTKCGFMKNTSVAHTTISRIGPKVLIARVNIGRVIGTEATARE